MAKSTAFSLLNTLLVVGLLAAIALTVYNREAISNRLSSLRGQTARVADAPTPTPTPDSTPTPTPAATPTPKATATPAASSSPVPDGSIVDITPETTPAVGGGSLPKSGPELNLAIATIPFALTGSGAYYVSLRRRLKKTWKDIEIR